jgi:hypothetical protein
MKNFAVAIVIGLGFSVYTPGLAADSTKPDATKPATSSATASPSTPTPATSSTTAKATVRTTAAGDSAAPAGHGKHHHNKVAHKHKKDELVGDGEPLTKLGEHKNVDGGFDFDNSKKFVK